MVPISDLRQIVIFGQLSDEMLVKLQPIIHQQSFNKDDVVFHEGDEAKTFFMIKQGKVLLEKRLSRRMTVSLGAIKPGYSFGWSAILGKLTSQMQAKCAEKCEILFLHRKDIYEVFKEDHDMGYIFMQQLGNLMKNRLDRMAEQLFRALKDHPDFKPLL